jgi:hypothetical protein
MLLDIDDDVRDIYIVFIDGDPVVAYGHLEQAELYQEAMFAYWGPDNMGRHELEIMSVPLSPDDLEFPECVTLYVVTKNGDEIPDIEDVIEIEVVETRTKGSRLMVSENGKVAMSPISRQHAIDVVMEEDEPDIIMYVGQGE